MRILYGIQLNGNGHLTRSVEIIGNLIKRGHLVDVITSGNNSNLKPDFEHKHFKGLDLFLNELGSVSWFKTLKKANIWRLFSDTKIDVSEYDLIISDFEPVSAWAAKRSGKRSIGISNQSFTLYNEVNGAKDFIYKEFVKRFAPCDEYLSINFQNNEGVFIHPIVSKKLLNKNVYDKGFILVYLSNNNLSYLIDIFSNFKQNFVIYTSESIECPKNIKLKKHDRDGFMSDLLSCSGVITASGFSTTSECLILGKKLWSIPFSDHYEQKSNSVQLKELGIFTDELSIDNLNKWINVYSPISYNWINPIDKIINKIESYES
jgi:uncharacterized protein (TIGR00661 family)